MGGVQIMAPIHLGKGLKLKKNPLLVDKWRGDLEGG